MIYILIKSLKRQIKPIRENVPVAISRALNDAIKQTSTAAKRMVTGRYNLSYAAVNKSSLYKQVTAKPNKPTATLNVASKQMPLIAFKGTHQNATEVKSTKEGTSTFSKLKNRKRNTGGTVVEVVKGKKQTIKSAFIAKTKSGHLGVFARGSYGKDFAFRTKRLSKKGNDLPIKELSAFSVPTAFLVPAIIKKVETKAKEVVTARLAHHMKFLAKK